MAKFDAKAFVTKTVQAGQKGKCKCKIGQNPAAHERMDAIAFEMKRQRKRCSSPRIAEVLSEIEGFSVAETTVQRHIRVCLQGLPLE